MRAEDRPSSKQTEIKFSNKEEVFLRKRTQQEQDLRWQAEYAEFTAAYNADIEAAGVPLDLWRTF
jgi:post-segregation antitoxin (ccd killing protein)